MRVRRQTGIALITAMLIAALVTAGAVALAASQQFNTRRTANLLLADRAALGINELEGAAGQALIADAKRAQYDAGTEAWAHTKFSTTRADLSFAADLSDLQGRFNLTNLSPDPRVGGEAGVPSTAASKATGAIPSEQNSAPPESDSATTTTSATTPPSPPAAPCVSGTPCGAVDTANVAPLALSKATPAQASATTTGAPALAPAQLAEQQFRLLFKALELDPEPIQAILDWIDPDTETRFPNGAEDDYYTNQAPAYRTANRPFVSPRELLLVKGVTVQMYKKLAPFIVTLPQSTKINVNTASKEVLMSLAPGIDASVAEQLIRARETQPFLSVESFLKHPLLQFRQVPPELIAIDTHYFELTSTASNERLDYRMRSLLVRNGAAVTTVARQRAELDE